MNRYNFSTSQVAASARVKLEEVINNRIASAQNVLSTIQNQIIEDAVVKGRMLNFEAAVQVSDDELESAKVIMRLPNGKTKDLHKNAVAQIAEKTGVPKKFGDTLTGAGLWGANLLAHNFNEIMSHGNGTKYLVRSVGNETRGFLSDRYRRIDSRPLVDAFAGKAQEFGLQPIEGYALDTTVRIRGILPFIFEPFPGEAIAFGGQWKNSDFGVGGNEFNLFSLRLACLNGMTSESLLRQVHLGAKLSEDFVFSDETYRLDTLTNVSKLKDVMTYALNPATIDLQIQSIREAHEQKFEPVEAKKLLKTKLSKKDAETVSEAYNSPDIEMMPSGNTVYRMANALSWVANLRQADGDSESALSLQAFAGELMPKVDYKTVEIG